MKDVNITNAGKILILGLGREGLSTYNFIRKLRPETILTLADRKPLNDLGKEFIDIRNNDKKIKFINGTRYLEDLNKFDLIIKTPGIPNKLRQIVEAKKSGAVFTSQTKIFLQNFRNKIIGITGTKGKSTTSSLIYHILKVSGVKCMLLGNIGIPVLDYFDKAKYTDYFVFEMSSHQLSDVNVSPHIGVFLNIFPEHLDYYLNFQDYLSAKANITKFQNSGDSIIYNGKFSEIKECIKDSPAKKVDFSSVDLPKIKTLLQGSHNSENIKAAFSVALEIGLNNKKIVMAIATFKPLEYRLEKAGVFKNIIFVNDTLATIPEATIAAVESYLNKQITLILGGYDRGIDFYGLAEYLSKKRNVINIILMGQTAGRIKRELLKNNYKGIIFDSGFQDMNQVVKNSAEITPEHGIVLLSPASTSFDMFKDYKDRGDQFKKAVQTLINDRK